ncbi:MAG: CCA tRNA nucleotidyltransferase [Candidatus Verstraetearchaeota archaeon]|jgi:tRNA nucleotidyltransferase (CCA-adding enzyme)|nr:CCA tRNA nucleotidyltransferase [Candidatus Verstraetearchaeota archaeon]
MNGGQLEKLLSDVLEELTPKDHERRKVSQIVRSFVTRISDICKEMGVDARAEVQGSVAKDTWISGDRDIDIFIVFPKTIPVNDVKTLGFEIARRAAGDNYVECYAEHPYVRAFVEGYAVDIVPCSEFDPKGGRPLTAVDRTPLHTRFINERFDDRLRAEVRLLKGFLKGIGAYGAEIKVSGFSGYLCELLILHYGSFLDVLRSARCWRPFSTVIDVAKHYEDPKRALKLFSSPLVVVDPVDKNRNVAAALSLEKLSLFMFASTIFLLKPSKLFFEPEERTLTEATKEDVRGYVERSGTTLLAIATTLKPSPPDVLWGQVKRSCNGIVKLLEQEGFKVLRWSAWSDDEREVILLVELESKVISPTIKHLGPPITSVDDVVKFVQKHVPSPSTVAGPYVEGDKLVVLTIKRSSDVVSFVKDNVHRAELSKDFAEALKGELRVSLNEEVLDSCRGKVSEYRRFLKSFLRGSPHWLQVLRS